MKIFCLICVLGSLASLTACDTQSKAVPYAEYTSEEKARVALDKKDFPEAIRLYKEVIAANPLGYDSYRFLSAAYAEQGGFDILTAITGTIDKSGSSLIDTLSDFLPAEPTEAQIESLRLATETLMLLPAEYRSYDNPAIETSSSAAQQLQFYQTAYSLIYIKKFTKVTETGALDISKLEEMTDADVDTILNNFEAIAETQGGGVVAEGVEDFISQLDAAPGGTRREKLLSYLEAHPPS
ncbi:MAG: hypothetical protein EOP10_08680 [Proteobacteria bacterium]|nr:MAG: hypothetical protein EOP10_08680 [Pseudomonadota bacterium]